MEQEPDTGPSLLQRAYSFLGRDHQHLYQSVS